MSRNQEKAESAGRFAVDLIIAMLNHPDMGWKARYQQLAIEAAIEAAHYARLL